MSFLNSALFPSLILLAGLPLVIHLLNLRFPKLFQFSSVQELRKTLAQRSRIFRWRHRILLLLRTLFLIALLLAFLKPILPRFGADPKTEAPRSVVIVVDHSMSMEHKGGGLSARQRAQAEAAKICDTLGPDDYVNIVLAGATSSTCFMELSRSHGEARQFIENLKPGVTHADLSQTNGVVARLLAKESGRPEIYYLSDFQRKSWSNVDFVAIPTNARVFFVDTGAGVRENRAILGAALSQAQILAGDTVSLEIEIANYTAEAMREPVKVTVDERSSFENEVSIPPWSVTKVSFPVPLGAPGLHLCEIRLADDDLPHDNQFGLAMRVMEKEGILIVSDTDPEKDAALYLKTALNPYEDLAGSLLPEQVSAAEIDPSRLAAAQKVFLTHSGKLNAAACKLLADFTFQGGGIVYFLDGESDAENLANLESAAAAGPLPLKLGPKRVIENVGASALQISRGDFKSSFLQIFRGPLRQNLALLEFYDIHEASSTGAGDVLLHYNDGTPAMASFHHGLGTMLFMNFSVSEFSSNLARQRVFPAWMQEIVKALTANEPVPAASRISEPVTAEVWKRDLEQAPLVSPSKKPVALKSEPLGERTVITFAPEELGIYSMRSDRLLNAYAVNPSPEESDLRPIDRSLLPSQLDDQGQQGYFVEGHSDFNQLVNGRPLFHWFLFAGLALLLAEQFFQLFLRRTAP